MNILYMMIPISILLGAGFVVAFIWSARDGQLDDVETPAHRILDDAKDSHESHNS